MNKQVGLSLIMGIVIGIFATSFAFTQFNFKERSETQNQPVTANNSSTSMNHNMAGMNHDSMSMDSMVTSLKGKTGDEFDKLFISEMIVHHQGAIDMAKMAQENAGHDEIKNLANDIINAQTSEIDQMKQWQSNWEY